ncbi:RHS repeat-associated core domain-containing protein [Thiolapillus sp.]|uniref:RHS repeat-associated core domain-containing protein n=1 Tax=Thiolapillus sp. TaxID=2017437 RepID=UPI0025D98AC7|nr:RHS repeat-associated core domain-containing protein [Thiolapillus sp.]
MKTPAILLLYLIGTGAALGGPRYAGGEYHGDLIQLGIRDLNPQLSRFTTPDPANQFVSGYTYGANAPMTYADPSGAMIGELALTESVIEMADETQSTTAEHTTLMSSTHSLPATEGHSLLLFQRDHAVRKDVPPWLVHHQEMLKRSTEHSDKIQAQLDSTKWLRSKMRPLSLNLVRRSQLNRKITTLTVELAQSEYWVDFYHYKVQTETSRFHAGIPGSPFSTIADAEGESWVLKHTTEDIPSPQLEVKTETPEGFQKPRPNLIKRLFPWLNRQR